MGNYTDKIEKKIKKSDIRISRIKQKLRSQNKKLSNLSNFINDLHRMSFTEIKDIFGNDIDIKNIINIVKKNGYYRS